MSVDTTQTSDTRIPISEALSRVMALGILKAYFRLGEPAITKNNNPKREVTLSFKLGNDWYKYSYTLVGYRLTTFLGEAERLDKSWAPFGIGANRDSTDRPTEFGKLDTLFFPSEVTSMLGLDDLVTTLASQQFDQKMKQVFQDISKQLAIQIGKPISLVYANNNEEEEDLSHPF